MNKKIKSQNNIIPTKDEIKNIPVTFVMFALLMVLFFSSDMKMALRYYKEIFSLSFFQLPNFKFQKEIALLTLFTIAIEWISRDKEYALKDLFTKNNRVVRWGFYYLLIFLICLFYIAPKGFIYAQF